MLVQVAARCAILVVCALLACKSSRHKDHAPPWSPSPQAAALAKIWAAPTSSGTVDPTCRKFACRDYDVSGFTSVTWQSAKRKATARRLLAQDPGDTLCNPLGFAPDFDAIGDRYQGERRLRLRGGPLSGVAFVRMAMIGGGCQVLVMSDDWPEYADG